MLSDFWRVLLEGRIFFWVKWYTPSISYAIYHTKASSFILKDNTVPCDSSYYLQFKGRQWMYHSDGHYAKKFVLTDIDYVENNIFEENWPQLVIIIFLGYSYIQTFEKKLNIYCNATNPKICSIQLKRPKYFFIHIPAEGKGAAFLTMGVFHLYLFFFFQTKKDFKLKFSVFF